MKCRGTVVDGNGKVARVIIESSACGDCHTCGFGAVQDGKSIEVNALNEVGAREGNEVFLEVSGRKVMEASVVLFLIPFMAFITGFLIGYYPAWYLFHAARTAVSVILAFSFLAGSYYLVHILGRASEFEFVIKGIATTDAPPCPPPPESC
ncbi:MAG: SoxR reducing system RseC family protein [Actinomycetia bacterium]|nr:SoxR reducing system RseC family protein [Actinomycetota bacterium]MCG2796071.1 SoxR reducing system RseC family protein [Actinomycetes bacterium]